jgi:hypothetical protein
MILHTHTDDSNKMKLTTKCEDENSLSKLHFAVMTGGQSQKAKRAKPEAVRPLCKHKLLRR